MENRGGAAYWLCLCKCGEWKVVKATYLSRGRSQSCGCAFTAARELRNARSFRDLTRRRCGRLKVVELAFRRRGAIYWRCKCDCGSEVVVNGKSLKRDATLSCGCLQRERASAHQKRAWRRPEYRGRKSAAQKRSCARQPRGKNGAFVQAA